MSLNDLEDVCVDSVHSYLNCSLFNIQFHWIEEQIAEMYTDENNSAKTRDRELRMKIEILILTFSRRTLTIAICP